MMHSPVINDKSSEKLPEIVTQYLRLCGLREKKIAGCHMGTRLYHDLGVYGEEAEAYLEVLVEQFQVDLTDFVFARFFPNEWPQGNSYFENCFLRLFPGIERLYKKSEVYYPITLQMVNNAINLGEWPDQ